MAVINFRLLKSWECLLIQCLENWVNSRWWQEEKKEANKKSLKIVLSFISMVPYRGHRLFDPPNKLAIEIVLLMCRRCKQYCKKLTTECHIISFFKIPWVFKGKWVIKDVFFWETLFFCHPASISSISEVKSSSEEPLGIWVKKLYFERWSRIRTRNLEAQKMMLYPLHHAPLGFEKHQRFLRCFS